MKCSVILEQRNNPEHLPNRKTEPEFYYKVLQTKNTLVVNIGQYLWPDEVHGLIQNKVEVTIRPIK